MESRSVRKTSLFTNTIPESASGTQFPPELVGSYKHVAVTLCVVQFHVLGRRHHLEARTSALWWSSSCSRPCAPWLLPRLLADPSFLGSRFVAVSGMGVFQRVSQQALAASLRYRNPPFQNSRHRVLSGVPQIPGHSVYPFFPSLMFSFPLRQHCVQGPNCVCVFNSPEFNLTG